MFPNVEYIKTLVNGLKEFVNSKIKQADWSQNDPVAKDYVKNRVCYDATTKTDISGLVIKNVNLRDANPDLPFELGQVWNVTCLNSSGKVVYKADNLPVQQSETFNLYIGDLNVNGIPFCIGKRERAN